MKKSATTVHGQNLAFSIIDNLRQVEINQLKKKIKEEKEKKEENKKFSKMLCHFNNCLYIDVKRTCTFCKSIAYEDEDGNMKLSAFNGEEEYSENKEDDANIIRDFCNENQQSNCYKCNRVICGVFCCCDHGGWDDFIYDENYGMICNDCMKKNPYYKFLKPDEEFYSCREIISNTNIFDIFTKLTCGKHKNLFVNNEFIMLLKKDVNKHPIQNDKIMKLIYRSKDLKNNKNLIEFLKNKIL